MQRFLLAAQRRALTFSRFLFLIALLSATATAQTNTFTYQGRLTDSQSGGSNSGSYLMEFRLFAAATGGAPIQTLTDVPATISNNVFTVRLDFTAANAFDGGERFLEIAVKRTLSDAYAALAPRGKSANANRNASQTTRRAAKFDRRIEETRLRSKHERCRLPVKISEGRRQTSTNRIARVLLT